MTIRRRVAIVVGIPAPYHDALFRGLGADPRIELRVLHCSPGHRDAGWVNDATAEPIGYTRRFLWNATPRRWRRLPLVGYTNLGIWRALDDFDPKHVILFGYSQIAFLLAALYCRRHGIPLSLRGDSHAGLEDRRQWHRPVRDALIRWLVRRSASVLAVGSANRDFWKRHGARNEQLHLAPFAVDAPSAVRSASESCRGPIRFLYVGRLVERKGVDRLLLAFNSKCLGQDALLTIVGDGPLAEGLRSRQTPTARAKTRWLGRLTNQQAREEMARADVLVVPSLREPWGLVVNEAMSAGLAVIASRRCGAALDLVRDGQTGWLLDEPTVEAIQSAMSEAACDPESTRRLGDRARTVIADGSMEACVDGFLGAIEGSSPRGVPSVIELFGSAAQPIHEPTGALVE